MKLGIDFMSAKQQLEVTLKRTKKMSLSLLWVTFFQSHPFENPLEHHSANVTLACGGVACKQRTLQGYWMLEMKHPVNNKAILQALWNVNTIMLLDESCKKCMLNNASYFITGIVLSLKKHING